MLDGLISKDRSINMDDVRRQLVEHGAGRVAGG
jgi:hypothetical protein